MVKRRNKPPEEIEGLREWLITFYEDQIKYYINNMGGITEFKTKVTPRILHGTIKRYMQISEEYDAINRRLLSEDTED